MISEYLQQNQAPVVRKDEVEAFSEAVDESRDWAERPGKPDSATGRLRRMIHTLRQFGRMLKISAILSRLPAG